MLIQRVSIAIVKNELGQVLLAKRGADVHMPDFWEFPGGKARKNESFKMALRRELAEEIDIEVAVSRKLIEFRYQYSDRRIHFQVFEVLSSSKQVANNEKQRLRWVDLQEIGAINFPPANTVIVDVLQLHSLYMIADESILRDKLFSVIEIQLKLGVKLVQFRAHYMTKSEYISSAIRVRKLCERYEASMISNCETSWVDEIKPHGVHLTSSRLRESSSVGNVKARGAYFSASCHSAREIDYANELGVRCILVGPIHQTSSHPHSKCLGWERFSELCGRANMPVFALGGIVSNELSSAIAQGAQGVAGIRMFI